jgi:hypothetical protein
VNAINPAPDKVQVKLAVIRLAEELGNVVLACRMMGFSRGSFYRARARYLAGGEAAVVDRARRPPEPTNRLAPAVEDEVVELSLAHPRWGRRRLVQALRQRGTSVSPSGVRCVWKRRGLLTENDRLARASGVSAVGAAASSDVGERPAGAVEIVHEAADNVCHEVAGDVRELHELTQLGDRILGVIEVRDADCGVRLDLAPALEIVRIADQDDEARRLPFPQDVVQAPRADAAVG